MESWEIVLFIILGILSIGIIFYLGYQTGKVNGEILELKRKKGKSN